MGDLSRPVDNSILTRVLFVIPLVLSLSVHEYAHAYSAYRLGDDTAARQGRLTLNPLVHIDPIGSLLRPMLGVPFGWAKPVPVNPARFDRSITMGKGMMITAAAGPISNLILAVLCALAYGIFLRFGLAIGVESLLIVGIQLNIALALFNLIPVPPLDGSRIVEGVIPYKFRSQWEQICRAGPLLLLAVIFFGGQLIFWPASYLQRMLLWLTGAIMGL